MSVESGDPDGSVESDESGGLDESGQSGLLLLHRLMFPNKDLKWCNLSISIIYTKK